MSGPFSFCRPLIRWKWNKKVNSQELSENRLEATKKDQAIQTKFKEQSAENAEVVPTTTKYITASGKQALTLLQSAAAVIPVPFLQEAIGVALKIIDVCEDKSAVEQKVKELQDRVCHLMVVIVDNVTAKNEEGSDEVIVKAAKSIEQDIKDLLCTLKTINEVLDKITAQRPWLLVIHKDLNKSAVNNCLQRLSTALEKFKLANDVCDSNLLQELHTRLARIRHLTQQMANKVDYVHEDVKDIKQILAKTRRSARRRSDIVVQQMPLKPEIFHGRGDMVKEITQLLMKEETSRICILGPGGMGKTSVSLGVVEQPLVEARFPSENRVWVPCIEATSAPLFLEILYIQLQVPGDGHVTLEKIISELDASKQPRLLLLDNFETPYNAPGGTRKQVEDILRRLARLSHVAILVTMRGRYPPLCSKAIRWQSMDIPPTDEAACLRIYRDIHPDSENDPHVGRLLSVLGHIPFAVTLMATLAKQGQSTAEELLVAWSKFGPDILPNQHEQSMNRSISLSVNSYLMKQNPQALLLLRVLSFLPAGTTKANLCWWIPTLDVSMIPSAIATLSNAALLVENKQQGSDSVILFVLPVVQSFMQHGQKEEEIRNNILSSCRQYVLDHACRYDDSAFPTKSKALAAEDTNIQAILCSSPTTRRLVSSNRTIEALIAFNWHRCDTKPNLEIANHTLMAAKASANKKHIASAIWCLGTTYFYLSEFLPAYNHLQEAYQLFNTLPPGDLESQRLCCRCGIDLVDAARIVLQAGMAVFLARDVEKRSSVFLRELVHARSLMLLGATLQRARQGREALRHLDHAIAILQTVPGSANNLAVVYQIISRVHYLESRFPEALDGIEMAWKYAESSGNSITQAPISLRFSIILFSVNRDRDAWKYIQIALMKSSHLGRRQESAHALEYMGYGYLRRGDYFNAYDAYEAAAGKYVGTFQEVMDGTRCIRNMAKIKQRQKNSDFNVGYERPLLDVDQSLFYPGSTTTWKNYQRRYRRSKIQL